MRSRYVAVDPHVAVYGNDDLPNVRALQKGFKLIALKDWGVSIIGADGGTACVA
jgi:hypothetical protein